MAGLAAHHRGQGAPAALGARIREALASPGRARASRRRGGGRLSGTSPAGPPASRDQWARLCQPCDPSSAPHLAGARLALEPPSARGTGARASLGLHAGEAARCGGGRGWRGAKLCHAASRRAAGRRARGIPLAGWAREHTRAGLERASRSGGRRGGTGPAGPPRKSRPAGQALPASRPKLCPAPRRSSTGARASLSSRKNTHWRDTRTHSSRTGARHPQTQERN